MPAMVRTIGKAQFITSPSGEELVVLPCRDYEDLVDALAARKVEAPLDVRSVARMERSEIREQRSAPLKTYPINEARAHFSQLVERTLAGEPQRVTRYGKETVVIVSEQEWRARSRSAPMLGALLAHHARAGTFREDTADRPWRERPLGVELG